MKEFHIRNVFIETALSLLPQVRPLEVEAEMPKRNFFVGAASILIIIIECPVHYVYDVKHLYLGSVELLGNLVPQCKHLKGKLMSHSI